MSRFLIDESLPVLLADELIRVGHEAAHIATLGHAGASDDQVYARAIATDAVLISRDLDFADTRRFSGTAGIIVVRLRSRIRILEFLATIVSLISDSATEIEALSGKVLILEPGRVRVRKK